MLESATLPIEQRTRAELFVYMRMEYTNPPLGTATLLANLQNEGLVIMDERKANAFWFINPDLAVDKHKYAENITSLDRELQRSKDDFIKEHYEKYGKEDFPPAWKLIDLTSFGCLTKLYFNFANGAVKKKIARSYSVPQQEILESWMKSINALRNCCAHHGRVWNRVMPVMPQLPMKLKQAWIKNKPEVANRLYSVLCCLLYWLNAIDSQNDLCANFKDLLSQYPEVDTNAMGFPKHWQNEPLWR